MNESCLSSNFVFDRDDLGDGLDLGGSRPGNECHTSLQPSANDYQTFLRILNEAQDVLDSTNYDDIRLSLEPRPIGPNGLEHVTSTSAVSAVGPGPEQVPSSFCMAWTPAQQKLEGSCRQRGGPRCQQDSANDSRFRQYQQDQWLERFQDLLDFKDTYGHVLVPHSYPPNQQLAQWIKRQRYQYKLKNLGRHSTLTDARQQELVAVGFVWDSHQAAWFEKFESLKLFRLQKGHCNVPSKYSRDPTLAIWVKCQRRQIKLFRKGLKSTMTPERFHALEGLGFDWNPRNL